MPDRRYLGERVGRGRPVALDKYSKSMGLLCLETDPVPTSTAVGQTTPGYATRLGDPRPRRRGERPSSARSRMKIRRGSPATPFERTRNRAIYAARGTLEPRDLYTRQGEATHEIATAHRGVRDRMSHLADRADELGR